MTGQIKMMTGRNLKLYFRDRGAVFFSLLSMIIVIALMTLFLGDTHMEAVTAMLAKLPGRDAAADKKNAELLVLSWTFAGIISINAVSVTLSALASMIRDKTSGRIHSIYTAPVSRMAIAVSYVLAAWAASVIICLLTLFLTEIYGVIKGMEWYPAVTHVQLTGFIMVNSFAYASFMYAAAVLVKSEGAWSGFGTVAGTLTGFLGGIYLPIGELSQSVGSFMKCTPVIYGAAMFRNVMTKDMLNTVFENAPEEMAETYREMMGIDLTVFDKKAGIQADLFLLLIFGIMFLMIAAGLIKYRKKTDR